MSAGFNKVILMGNLTRDPELKYTPSGTAVASFAIAVNSGWGENERVDFFDVETWKKSAENCEKYLSKGSRVLVDGKLVQDRWETEEGNKRSRVKITAFSVQFLNTRDGDGGGSNATQSDVDPDDNIPF